MNNLNRLLTSTILCALAATGVFAATSGPQQQKQPYQTAPPPVPAGGPSWLDVQDLGNGVELRTSVGVTPHAVLPGTATTVRAVSINVDFLYGVGVMQSQDYLMLHDVADTTPLVWKFIGVDRNIVVDPRPPLDILSYEMTVTPKPGYSWGTVANATHLDIDVLAL